MAADEDKLVIRKDSYISFDKNLGHYVLTNKRVFHDVILISVPSLLKLESELFNILGPVAKNILQIIGEGAGGESGKRMLHVENMEDDVKTVFNSVSKWGFGKYELVDLNLEGGNIKFKLLNNPLFIGGKKDDLGLTDQAKTRNHDFLIGFYTGYFHVLLNAIVSCKETKCINQGDTFCEF